MANWIMNFLNFAADRPALAHRNCVDFDVESLESRKMLAGNVSVKISGDRLVLNGDSEDNSLSVFAVNGQVIVDAYNNTTLSGDATSDRSFNTGIAESDLKLLKVNLKGGDDLFDDNQISHAAKMVISLGQGDDFLAIGSGDRNGTVTLKTGGGADDVFLGVSTEIDGNFTLNTGGGNDEVNVGSSFGDIVFNAKTRIVLGGGDDTLEMKPNAMDFGSLLNSISGGGGSDTFDADGTSLEMIETDFNIGISSFETDLAMPPV